MHVYFLAVFKSTHYFVSLLDWFLIGPGISVSKEYFFLFIFKLVSKCYVELAVLHVAWDKTWNPFPLGRSCSIHWSKSVLDELTLVDDIAHTHSNGLIWFRSFDWEIKPCSILRFDIWSTVSRDLDEEGTGWCCIAMAHIARVKIWIENQLSLRIWLPTSSIFDESEFCLLWVNFF